MPPLQLTWKYDARLAALHLSHCVCTYPESSCDTNAENQKTLTDLGHFGGRLDVPPDRFWDLLFQLTLDCNGHHDLSERLCVRCLPPAARPNELVDQLGYAIQAAVHVLESELPDFPRVMKLRQGPIQEQWEATGPGLWRSMSQFLDSDLFVPAAEVCLVVPVLGGFGWAHLSTNRCHIEAVLTNAHPQLSETMRLAWLLSQLDFERPCYSDLINARRLRTVAGLATLPAVLLAAEDLGLSSFNANTVAEAIKLWRIQPASHKTQALAEVLLVWWETFQSGQVDWSVALTGLDRMLSE